MTAPEVGLGVLPREDPELAERYGAYRRRQAAALLPLLPREALRPLYALARGWAEKEGVHLGKDPLATLLLFLEEFLPLPPLTVWLEDRVAHPREHLAEEFEAEEVARAPAPPVTVDSRPVELGGKRWQAALCVFRREGAWRGFIAFRGPEGGERARTTDVFREESPEEIQDRFRSFHPQTLQAFLRSVLP